MVNVVVTAGIANTAPCAIPTRRHTRTRGGWSGGLDALVGQTDDHPPAIDVDEVDTALIAYTGGTTGRQKGVVHTQRGLRDNLLPNVIEIGLLDATNSRNPAHYIVATDGLVPGRRPAMLKGAHTLLERRFEPIAVLERIERARITFLFMVLTMIYRLLDCAHGSSRDLTSLRTILCSARFTHHLLSPHLQPDYSSALYRIHAGGCTDPGFLLSDEVVVVCIHHVSLWLESIGKLAGRPATPRRHQSNCDMVTRRHVPPGTTRRRRVPARPT